MSLREEAGVLSWTSTTVPADSEYSYVLDSTYMGNNSMASTATANRVAGNFRGQYNGKRWHVTVECTDDAATLYLDYLTADDTWEQDVMGSSTGNCTADTVVVFDLSPESVDYRIRILAAADNPTAMNVTITESTGVEGAAGA